MEITTENIETAVSVFYRSEDTQQAEAHQWLTAAQNSPLAWKFVWDLLNLKRSSEVQFFGATTLHIKLLRYWHEVPEEHYESLKQKILQTIILYTSGPKIILNRLCIALSAFIIHTIPSFWPNAFEELVSNFQPNSFPNIDPERVIWVLLEILTVIPEEFQSMILASSQRKRVRTILQSVSRDIIGVVEICLSRLVGSSFNMSHITTYFNSARCSSAWIQLGGVTINECTHLMELLVDLISFVYWSREDSDGLSLEEIELIEVSLEALSAIILNPQTFKYKSCVTKHAYNFVNNFNKIIENERQSSNSNKDVVTGICGLMVTTVDTHSKQFIQHLQSTNTEEQKLTLELLNILMKCTNLPGKYPVDELTSILTFGFWFTLQDDVLSLEPSENTAILPIIKEYYRQLVVVLLRKCQYPSCWEESVWSSDDKELFRCYRQDVSDTLMYCYNVLNVEMLNILTVRLSESIAEAEISRENCWPAIESCIYAFAAVAESIEYENVYLPKFFLTLKSIPYFQLNSKVYAMALDAIGAYSEWISEKPDLLQLVVPSVLLGLNDPNVCANATMALKDLTTNCQKSLSPYSHDVLEMCQMALRSGHLKLSEQVRLMFSVGKVISLLPMSKLMDYLNPMLSPLFEEIDSLLKTDQQDRGVTACIISKLKIISSLFCTLHVEKESCEVQPILIIVRQTLPLYMELTRRYYNNPSVMEVLCNLLKHTLFTLMDDSKPLIPDILNLTLAAFNQHPLTSLIVLAKAILLMFGKDEDFRVSMKNFLSEIVKTTLQLSVSESSADHSDIVEGFFSLLTQILKKDSPLVTANETVNCADLFQYAIASLGVPEIQTMKSSSYFLLNFICQSRENGHEGVVMHYGESLITQIFLNLGGSGPRSSVEALSEILFTLNKKYCDTLSRWLKQILLYQNDFPSPRVTHHQKDVFIKAVLKEKVNKRRLADCVMEFTLRCRGILQTE